MKKVRTTSEFLGEHIFMVVVTSFILISTTALTYAGAQEFDGIDNTRTYNARVLNDPYGVKVLKTLGSKRILVEKDDKTLRCETPTIQELDAKSPIHCTDDVVLYHK